MLLLLIFAIVNSVTIYVASDAGGTGDGSSWVNAFTDLQSAIGDSNPGDDIYVKKGMYKPTDGTDRSISFIFPKGVSVYGSFEGTEFDPSERTFENPSILSGDLVTARSYHVVKLDEDNYPTLINGFRIEKGSADGDVSANGFGGGLVCTNTKNTRISTLVEKCEFVDNNAATGGGAYLYLNCDIDFKDTKFKMNTATKGTYFGGYGGGLTSRNGCYFDLENVIFEENTADISGGAFFADYGCRVNIINSEFQSNDAEKLGGAIYVNDRNSQHLGSTITLEGSFFKQNSAGEKGAAAFIYLDTQFPFRNNTFESNTVTIGDNYAITCHKGDPDGANCTNLGENTYIGDLAQVEDFENFDYPDDDPGLTYDLDVEELMSYVKYKSSVVTLPQENTNRRYVDGDSGVDTANGESWGTAFSTIQKGIDSCALSTPCDVFVKAGTYIPTTKYFWEGKSSEHEKTIVLETDVYVYGGFKGDETSRNGRDIGAYITYLSGEGTPQKLHVVKGATDSYLDGFVITKGDAFVSGGPGRRSENENERRGATSPDALLNSVPTSSGGGMLNRLANMKISNVLFFENKATKGGHIYNIKSNVELENVVMYNGVGSRGGCISNDLQMTFTCNYCVFMNCYSVGKGGGIYNDFGITSNIDNSIFTSLKAFENGGAIVNDGSSSATIDNTNFCSVYGEMGSGVLQQGSYNGTMPGTASSSTLTDCKYYNAGSKYGNEVFFNWADDVLTESNCATETSSVCDFMSEVPDNPGGDVVPDDDNAAMMKIAVVILVACLFLV